MLRFPVSMYSTSLAQSVIQRLALLSDFIPSVDGDAECILDCVRDSSVSVLKYDEPLDSCFIKVDVLLYSLPAGVSIKELAIDVE